MNREFVASGEDTLFQSPVVFLFACVTILLLKLFVRRDTNTRRLTQGKSLPHYIALENLHSFMYHRIIESLLLSRPLPAVWHSS